MFGKKFELNDRTMEIVEELGRHMPGGFFIYRAEEPEELIYANQAAAGIFGCRDAEELRSLTGWTFRGMVHPEDYDAVKASIGKQISTDDEGVDHVEYRIIRKDGAVRWVDDYGHYTETEAYGGIYYVFISDITDKRKQMERDMAVRQAVIEALSKAYHTVWLINDVESESFSLYRGDIAGSSIHAAPIRSALERMKYSQAKEYYIQTMVAPADRQRLQEELAIGRIVSRLQEKPQFNINYLRIMEDGSERYFRIEFARVSMPGGKMGVVCGFKDVDDDVRTGQKMQQALRDAKKQKEENSRLIEQIESAAKLADLMGSVATLLSNMPAMSFSKDAETGRYLACNQAFAEYAHKETPEGVVGKTDFDIFDPETARHFTEDDRKALAMEEPYIFFEDVPDAAGHIRNLQTTKLKFTDSNGRQCTLGMCVDVTEMSRAKAAETEARVKQQELEHRIALQEELLQKEREQAEQTKLITALASDYRSVYYIDLDTDEGVCYQCLPDADGLRTGEHFRYLHEFSEYGRKYITEQYLDDFLAFIQPQNLRTKLSTELVVSYRYLVRRHGSEFYEMIKFAGVRHPEDRDDHLVHSVGACITDVDIETRKNLVESQALTDALKAAEQANIAKTAFLSNMSHEIRTPMNAIIGLNSIALSEEDISDRTRGYLERIGTSARHLLSIINDILDMSRIESGRMVIRNEEFSFTRLLEQVNTIIGGQCKEKGLHYTCRTAGRIDEYYIGDEMKLRQVMINILGNAVKFTPSGGNIDFTIEELNRFSGRSTLRFVIADTGIGMSREFLPHIFESFSQEHSSSTSRYGSTGLGMPITRSIVELMNGTIEVESEKGKGSVFTVAVTLGVSSRRDRQEDSSLPSHLSVLVIDDDPVACEHAQIIFGNAGIACQTAASGKEGLEMVRMHKARSEAYDLILTDWKMPEMDGVETARQIRSVIGDESAIIILTSYSWDEIEETARTAGVDGFVSKPLDSARVMDAYAEAYGRRPDKRTQKTAELSGRRILLAEDIAVNAEIMRMLLSAKGMQTDLAVNGAEAVDAFVNNPPGTYDAILMDMRMPVMDGLEASAKIRACGKEDALSVPIIALTANAFDEDVQRSMQAGLNAHLSKPIDPDLLCRTLQELIND